ncbi:hypothetical protein COLO4_15653 [Corchorus olitorius]|uniref:Uncharacterized protein n=1 Tax=Corchorus olitorius TaxID=93759 RepID=A0A1R3JLY3_9ROSI|nr:hypothetical protein COLO4_15653 [Corchorus olitorius]
MGKEAKAEKGSSHQRFNDARDERWRAEFYVVVRWEGERVSIVCGGILCCEEREGQRVCVWFVEEDDKIMRLG